MKLPMMPYVSCATKCYQTVLHYLPSVIVIMILITLNIRTISFHRKLEALTNCQGLMVRSSKTDNENARSLLQSKLPYRTCMRLAYSCRYLIKTCTVEMATCVLGEQLKKKFETVQLSIIPLNVTFKICQKNNWHCDLNPALLFRSNLTNQQTCHG
jgi:hypothetical protein